MSASFIRTENLSHRYTTNWAIRDINIDITRTGIYGFLGSNGAGKSTTLNILCGVLKQTSGNVFLSGIDLLKEPVKAKRQIGFLPQQPPLYLDMTVLEYLTYCAELRRMDDKIVSRAVNEVMDQTGIKHFSNRLIKNLSGGYRQRVGIAQAIIHQPGIVVLDEPTNGLDPNQIIEVRKLIRSISHNRVVVISSHILTEVQLLCDQIIMIENGQMVFSDTMDAFNNYMAPNSVLAVFEKVPDAQQLTSIAGVVRVEMLNDQRARIFFDGDGNMSARFIQASVQRNWNLQELSIEKGNVDDIFKQLSQQAK